MKTNTSRFLLLFAVCLFVVGEAGSAFSWYNGPNGNDKTDHPSKCGNPPYSIHDWIAEHALALLPDREKEWIIPHKTLYLTGTEAPDNGDIPAACNGPKLGYSGRIKGHSVRWNNDYSELRDDRAARLALEEYNKARSAFAAGNPRAAAFYLGAVAHYVGDVSVYAHSNSFKEKHHAEYEDWVGRRTGFFDDGTFESFAQADELVTRTAYTAVERISKATARGNGRILSAQEMDSRYEAKDQEYMESIGYSLNLGVNELADVLHTFFVNVVSKSEF